LQVHGAIGYTAEHDVSLYLTKVQALAPAWGSQAQHRSRVLSVLAGTVLAGTVLAGTVLAGTVLAGTVLAGTVLAGTGLTGAGE
jgi:hypothetical protein